LHLVYFLVFIIVSIIGYFGANLLPFGLSGYLLFCCTDIYLCPYALSTSVINNKITSMFGIVNVVISQMIFVLFIIYEEGHKSDLT